MKLSEIKSRLENLSEVKFQLPNGEFVPQHFHITEVGIISRHFIDCGGTMRDEKTVNFQLWEDRDYDHRLGAKKLHDIITLSETKLGIDDNLEIEVEYQGSTIGKYHLDFMDDHFVLLNTQTDCLAKDKCGIPASKPKVQLADVSGTSSNSCEPGGGCC
ncbi:hypothetical protein SAMN05661096_02896 [Marivirga sericea]|uniref:Uncharacterized protein n=1 Tax=Marivirga sericea TaxID=1028 RepID=A0A1X7KLW3_9BACT|nr:DUF6428 family protein [Marivirga sericea]SMG42446.1 hypothetical protein SAMN05661096_02896 [Marivirga sericea]